MIKQYFAVFSRAASYSNLFCKTIFVHTTRKVILKINGPIYWFPMHHTLNEEEYLC